MLNVQTSHDGVSYTTVFELQTPSAGTCPGQWPDNADAAACVAPSTGCSTVTLPGLSPYAYVQGYAIGGGLEWALACDMRFAAAGVQMGFPFGPWNRFELVNRTCTSRPQPQSHAGGRETRQCSVGCAACV